MNRTHFRGLASAGLWLAALLALWPADYPAPGGGTSALASCFALGYAICAVAFGHPRSRDSFGLSLLAYFAIIALATIGACLTLDYAVAAGILAGATAALSFRLGL